MILHAKMLRNDETVFFFCLLQIEIRPKELAFFTQSSEIDSPFCYWLFSKHTRHRIDGGEKKREVLQNKILYVFSAISFLNVIFT